MKTPKPTKAAAPCTIGIDCQHPTEHVCRDCGRRACRAHSTAHLGITATCWPCIVEQGRRSALAQAHQMALDAARQMTDNIAALSRRHDPRSR